MLKVYICEDIKEHRDRILEMVQDIIDVENLDNKIEMVSDNPKGILDHVKEINEGAAKKYCGKYFHDKLKI